MDLTGRDTIMTVLQLSIRLLLFILAGFIGRKTKVMADGFDKMLSRFILTIPLWSVLLENIK